MAEVVANQRAQERVNEDQAKHTDDLFKEVASIVTVTDHLSGRMRAVEDMMAQHRSQAGGANADWHGWPGPRPPGA